jgi:hypothetical protein
VWNKCNCRTVLMTESSIFSASKRSQGRRVTHVAFCSNHDWLKRLFLELYRCWVNHWLTIMSIIFYSCWSMSSLIFDETWAKYYFIFSYCDFARMLIPIYSDSPKPKRDEVPDQGKLLLQKECNKLRTHLHYVRF